MVVSKVLLSIQTQKSPSVVYIFSTEEDRSAKKQEKDSKYPKISKNVDHLIKTDLYFFFFGFGRGSNVYNILYGFFRRYRSIFYLVTLLNEDANHD